MPFVLDASIAACWAFDDEDHPVATLVLERIRTDSEHDQGHTFAPNRANDGISDALRERSYQEYCADNQ